MGRDKEEKPSGGGLPPPSLKERETNLRRCISILSDAPDEPAEVAAALTAIRRELRASPEGPGWVVQVSSHLLPSPPPPP